MQISLEGKVAIATGVSGDGQVGQAVARALADSGAQALLAVEGFVTMFSSCARGAPCRTVSTAALWRWPGLYGSGRLLKFCMAGVNSCPCSSHNRIARVMVR